MVKILDTEGNVVEYQHLTFPDSQQMVRIVELPKKVGSFTIRVRLASFTDVELLLLVVAALKTQVPSFKLFIDIVYLLGGRSDRSFGEGQPNYLRDILAPIINSLNPTQVTILDPHSYSSETAIKKSKPYTVLPILLERYMSDSCMMATYDGTIQIVIPDSGAEKRVLDTIKQFRQYTKYGANAKFNIIQCLKTRNSSGVIDGIRLLSSVDPDIRTVIIDDLCDGGKTFLEIANKLSVKDCSLIVTHSIFSKGIEPLTQEFERVYTTNSFKDHPSNLQLDVLKVI